MESRFGGTARALAGVRDQFELHEPQVRMTKIGPKLYVEVEGPDDSSRMTPVRPWRAAGPAAARFCYILNLNPSSIDFPDPSSIYCCA